MCETCGELGFVTSWIERDSRGKGGIRRKRDRKWQPEIIRRTEKHRQKTAVATDWGAGRPGWHCFEYSSKVKCSFQQRGLPCHSRGCWRGIMATNSMVLNVLTYFHCPCDITLMTCLVMSIQCIPGMRNVLLFEVWPMGLCNISTVSNVYKLIQGETVYCFSKTASHKNQTTES